MHKEKLTNVNPPRITTEPFFESHEKTTDMYHTSLILNDLRESFSGMKFYICIPDWMTDEIQRLLKAFLSDNNDCTYRRIIVRETKIGGFLEPAIIKATEFNISLQPSPQFRIDEITECATSKRKWSWNKEQWTFYFSFWKQNCWKMARLQS